MSQTPAYPRMTITPRRGAQRAGKLLRESSECGKNQGNAVQPLQAISKVEATSTSKKQRYVVSLKCDSDWSTLFQ